MQTVSVGISKLQRINLKALKELKDILLVEEFSGKPIVAVVPYNYYLEIQGRIIKAYELINENSDLLKKLEELPNA